MADIRKIVDLYELYGSKKRVARELNISRNTVKKYLDKVKAVQDGSSDEILPMDRKIRQPSRVLTEPVLDKIHQYLESNLERPRKQRLTAKRICELLNKDGHKIGYTTVKDEVSRWKRANSPRDVYILQEPRVGQRAEFDWGEVHLYIGDMWLKFNLAVFVLPFSLYRFARLYPRSTQMDVLHAHTEFFQDIGAVPQAIFYDRMAAVYNSQKQEFNEKFIEFSMHFGFSPCVCNPSSPHEKGTDEESVGYVRRVAFGERSSFKSLEEAQNWLVKCIAEINTHPVYRRQSVPAQGLIQERDQMHSLPTLEYSNCELKRAAISRYSLVKFEGNFYSVPDTYRPRHITLKILVDRIMFLDGNDCIASHLRLTGKQKYSMDIAHYITTFHSKPGALPNSRVLAQADQMIQDLFNRYYMDNPKEFLPILDLMRETPAKTLYEALTILKEQDIPPTYDTIRFFLHNAAAQMVRTPEFKGGFEVDEPDLADFDQMLVDKIWI
jgi:transposase